MHNKNEHQPPTNFFIIIKIRNIWGVSFNNPALYKKEKTQNKQILKKRIQQKKQQIKIIVSTNNDELLVLVLSSIVLFSKYG